MAQVQVCHRCRRRRARSRWCGCPAGLRQHRSGPEPRGRGERPPREGPRASRPSAAPTDGSSLRSRRHARWPLSHRPGAGHRNRPTAGRRPDGRSPCPRGRATNGGQVPGPGVTGGDDERKGNPPSHNVRRVGVSSLVRAAPGCRQSTTRLRRALQTTEPSRSRPAEHLQRHEQPPHCRQAVNDGVDQQRRP